MEGFCIKEIDEYARTLKIKFISSQDKTKAGNLMAKTRN